MKNRIKLILKAALLILSPPFYKYLFYYDLRNFLKTNKSKNKEPEMFILNKLVIKDKIALDVGANYGSYTYLLERLIPSDKIYAFEPIPKLYNRLKKVFPKVNVFDFALSDSTGIAKFKIPQMNHKIFYSRGTLQTNIVETNETGRVEINVNTIALDSFVEKNNIGDIGFIKIDVEGNEMNVIKGGLRTIKKNKPVMQIEIEQRHHKEDINGIIDSIKEFGYNCFYLNDKIELERLNKNALDLQLSNDSYTNNFIFLPL